MAQSIPSVTIPAPLPPGHLLGISHFVLEKFQMPQGGAGCSYKKSTVGLKKKDTNAPPRDNTKIVFSSFKISFQFRI